jgi:hypothetical protein
MLTKPFMQTPIYARISELRQSWGWFLAVDKCHKLKAVLR